jgi:hypothetical protein
MSATAGAKEVGISMLTGFSKWWFLAGGSRHALWKQRDYTAIYEKARNLPKAAWDEATKLEREECAKIAECYDAQFKTQTDVAEDIANQIRERK